MKGRQFGVFRADLILCPLRGDIAGRFVVRQRYTVNKRRAQDQIDDWLTGLADEDLPNYSARIVTVL
jgi:hypothetical protein